MGNSDQRAYPGSISMEKYISVVIPNYNGEATIGKCLEAAFASNYKNFEVVVVDDCSDDRSGEIIKQYPCKLLSFDKRSGTSRARNAGARNCSGEVVFFIDADCLLEKDTLSIVNQTMSALAPDHMVGGTYAEVAYDDTFFNTFQSVWINYSETRKAMDPDYIAAHAMIMFKTTFDDSQGFPEDFMPIIEDVEYSHRLKRSGIKLMMNPDIQVRHIFGFNLPRSLCNAYRKTAYWCLYSLSNKDLFSDSGTASAEFKTNVALYVVILVLLLISAILRNSALILFVPVLIVVNVILSRKLISAFLKAKGRVFAFFAFLYYSLLYPLPVALGTAAGMMKYINDK
jgi:glycosyltransferase involved in cell wall biosynthesis